MKKEQEAPSKENPWKFIGFFIGSSIIWVLLLGIRPLCIVMCVISGVILGGVYIARKRKGHMTLPQAEPSQGRRLRKMEKVVVVLMGFFGCFCWQSRSKRIL